MTNKPWPNYKAIHVVRKPNPQPPFTFGEDEDNKPRLPSTYAPLWGHKTVWSGASVQYLMEVSERIHSRLFDARDPALVSRDVAESTLALVDMIQVWSWHYFGQHVIPFTAIYLMQVLQKMEGMASNGIGTRANIIDMMLDFADWRHFNTTGEFLTVEDMASAIDTRILMETRQ